MSRARGLVLQNALARYLSQWWPSAESAGSGRQGSDILGTPGIVWECKTAREFRPLEWCRQAKRHALCQCECTQPEPCTHGEIAVTIYWPDGIGERSADVAIAMMPLADMVGLLADRDHCVCHVEVEVVPK